MWSDLRIQRNELAEPLLEGEAGGRRLDRHGVNRVLSGKAQQVVGTAFSFGAFSNRMRVLFGQVRGLNTSYVMRETRNIKDNTKIASAANQDEGKERRTFEVHINSGGGVKQLLRHAVFRGGAGDTCTRLQCYASELLHARNTTANLWRRWPCR